MQYNGRQWRFKGHELTQGFFPMGTLGTILSWAVFGLVIGVIARFLYPGRQPMSILATMALGIVGSLLGGFISYLLGNNPEAGPFRGAGWIMSIIGAMVVVWIALYMNSRSGPAAPPV
jgi:uncharacterized membrane protein YeaQ/YmgE (transglycosylase-associated protein family)